MYRSGGYKILLAIIKYRPFWNDKVNHSGAAKMVSRVRRIYEEKRKIGDKRACLFYIVCQ